MAPLDTLDAVIVKTVLLFDLVERPLTALEVWEYLYQPSSSVSFLDLWTQLESSPAFHALLETRDGFYFLKGRDALVPLRHKRYRASMARWKRARRFFSVLRWIPFVQVGAVAGSAGYGNAGEDSDIDCWIMGKRGTLATIRAMAVALAELMGGRPAPDRSRNTFCLSFFVAEKEPMERIALSGEDPLLAWWMLRLMPIVDYPGALSEFYKKNPWIFALFPNASEPRVSAWFRLQPIRFFSGLARVIFSIPSRVIVERMAQMISRSMGSKRLWAMANEGRGVVMDEGVLKLHMNDTRRDYLRAFHERYQMLCNASPHS